MEEKEKKKPLDIIRNYWWVLSILMAICAILSMFFPVLTYEIREAVYDNLTEERLSKVDYVYSMNLISYFTTGFKLNYMMYITLGIIFAGIGFVVGGIFKKELRIVGGIAFLLAICFIVLFGEFFSADINEVMTYAKVVGTTYDPATQTFVASFHGASISWGSAIVIIFLSLAFATTVFTDVKSTTRQIAEEGVLISAAFVLNFIKIPIGPSGGSINFQMLPLMIIALRHGPIHGFISGGVIYGLLSCLTDGYGFACYPFDYLIGFGSVGIMGLFRNFIFSEEQKTYNFKGLLFIFIGGTLSTFVRYFGSNVSSIVIYGLDLRGALIYNSFYIPLSGLIAIIPLMALYKPLIDINRRFPVKRETISA